MSFNAKEISTRDGKPLEMIEFIIDGSTTYRYTNAVETIQFNGNDFTPAFIVRSSISESQEIENSNLTVTVDRDSPIVDLFATNNVANKIVVKLWRFHYGDSEVVSYWYGIVSSVTRSNTTADITCDSPERELEVTSLRQQFQPTCRKFLGDGRCPVDLEQVKTIGNVTAKNDLQATITIAEVDNQPDGYFKFGYVKINNDYRFIVNHVGSVLTLLNKFGFNPVGMSATAYPGCNYLPSDCSGKFGSFTNNGRDFGGFYVSIENYFEKGIR